MKRAAHNAEKRAAVAVVAHCRGFGRPSIILFAVNLDRKVAAKDK